MAGGDASCRARSLPSGGDNVPLHLVGYSNGGALAMKYPDALESPSLRKPQQLVLLSPMIGVTAFARFAGFAGLPALLPAFAKAAWLNIAPEYNPYKYNSFPVNAARRSWLLTKALQEQIGRAAQNHTLDRLPPVLAFQSVMDSTSVPVRLSRVIRPASGQRQRTGGV